MRLKLIFAVLFSSVMSVASWAAQVDTVMVYSDAMARDVECVVITPDGAQKTDHLPVVYLLHGYGGSHKTWTNLFDIENLADRYNVMVVTPNGLKTWYWDSPMNPEVRYETFLSKELINYVDSHYPTLSDRSGRAISGFSMGGHGALFTAIRHQDVFGVVGSMSGGVDIRPFPGNWDMAAQLGSLEEHPKNWDDYTVINQLHLLENGSLEMIIDCGVDDFFYDVNIALHDKLTERGITHRFTTDKGAHNLEYWRPQLEHHLLFFTDYFKRQN